MRLFHLKYLKGQIQFLRSTGAKMKLLSTHVSILAPLILTRNYFEKKIFKVWGQISAGPDCKIYLEILTIWPQKNCEILGPNFHGAKLQIISITIVNLAPFIFGPSGAKFTWGQNGKLPPTIVDQPPVPTDNAKSGSPCESLLLLIVVGARSHLLFGLVQIDIWAGPTDVCQIKSKWKKAK